MRDVPRKIEVHVIEVEEVLTVSEYLESVEKGIHRDSEQQTPVKLIKYRIPKKLMMSFLL